MKPIIGVFGQVKADGEHALNYDYVKAISAAGAIPVILTYTESEEDTKAIINMVDGFCFTGGVDVDPARYNEEKHEKCGEVQPMRDALELLAVPHILSSGKPVMGICRGAQLINIALGGTLYQDIPTMIPDCLVHRQTETRYEYSHSTRVLSDTPLAELLGEGEVRINSFHHQSIKDLGDGLVPMALDSDGVVEAVYYKGGSYMMLYQWHPECLCGRDEGEMRLFADFVKAALEFKDNN